jgi:hypothetical protein
LLGKNREEPEEPLIAKRKLQFPLDQQTLRGPEGCWFARVCGMDRVCDLRHRLHLIPETRVTLFWNNGIAEVTYVMERECYCG